MAAHLVVFAGDARSSTVPLPEGIKLRIGRGAGMDLCLPDPYVSREHAELTMDRGLIYLRDLVSRNGTWVNGRRLSPDTTPQAIWPGDVARVGNTQLRIRPGTVDNEREWLTCRDPDLMLRSLKGKSSERKLRLFACACFRCVWNQLEDRESRDLVLLTERFADGKASQHELQQATTLLGEYLPHGSVTSWPVGLDSALEAANRSARRSWLLAEMAPERDGLGIDAYQRPDQSWVVTENALGRTYRQIQCELLRDIFTPFYSPAIQPRWLDSNDHCVRKVAQVIYQDGTFQDMPVLADALEESGCSNEILLEHCRKPHPHVRGCWALDAVLGHG
jgi:hypothetical protein